MHYTAHGMTAQVMPDHLRRRPVVRPAGSHSATIGRRAVVAASLVLQAFVILGVVLLIVGLGMDGSTARRAGGSPPPAHTDQAGPFDGPIPGARP
jgi:hypothetical protein